MTPPSPVTAARDEREKMTAHNPYDAYDSRALARGVREFANDQQVTAPWLFDMLRAAADRLDSLPVASPLSDVSEGPIVGKVLGGGDLSGQYHTIEDALFDSVNRPAHYAATRIECIDAIGAMVEGMPGESAYYAGNVVKYVWRHRGKQSVESLRKARWYLDRLITISESVSGSDTP